MIDVQSIRVLVRQSCGWLTTGIEDVPSASDRAQTVDETLQRLLSCLLVDRGNGKGRVEVKVHVRDYPLRIRPLDIPCLPTAIRDVYQ
jgi:hypothetical protein